MTNQRSTPYIIGIAGGTGSGKTTIARKIQTCFSTNAVIMSHDSYYRSHPELSFTERQKQNYDHPAAYETELFVKDLKKLQAGQSIQKPTYSFTQHLRTSETTTIEPCQIIIIEGILVLESPALRKLMAMKLFVDTDADVRFIRRLTRDMQERQRTLKSVVTQYLNTVKPMHDQFVEPSKRYADVIIPEGGHNQVALEMIIERLKAKLNH